MSRPQINVAFLYLLMAAQLSGPPLPSLSLSLSLSFPVFVLLSFLLPSVSAVMCFDLARQTFQVRVRRRLSCGVFGYRGILFQVTDLFTYLFIYLFIYLFVLTVSCLSPRTTSLSLGGLAGKRR